MLRDYLGDPTDWRDPRTTAEIRQGRAMRPETTYGPGVQRAMRARARTLRKLAALHGYRGAMGGWIYNVNGKPICQGWNAFERCMPRLMRHLVTGNPRE